LRSDATTTKALHLNGEDRPNIYEKFSGPTVEILTGHKTRPVKLEGIRPGSPQFSKLRQELIAAQRDHLLIKAGVAGGHKMVPKIAGDHAYAVLGYDKKQDLVHIWNPWGDTFTPDGPDNIQNGYTTKSGEFEIPLKDFVIVYSDVKFETKTSYRD
jgi:dTDP-4-dehydrorhamnose 3,5-epimerase-like enzyme